MRAWLVLVLMLTPHVMQHTTADLSVVRLYVYASRPVDGFIPPNQKDRDDSARDLRRALAARFAPQLFVRRHPPIRLVTAIEDADIIIDVVDRTARDDWRIVRATLTVRGVTIPSVTIPIEGTNDDGDWSDAAKDLGRRLVQWTMDNRARLRP